MGLVPATTPCNKSQGLVVSCELAIFATKSSRRDPGTIVAGAKVGLRLDFEAKMASSHDATSRLCDLLQGLVSSCVRP